MANLEHQLIHPDTQYMLIDGVTRCNEMLRFVNTTFKTSQKELEESWKQIWSPQESMKLTCSMNYTRNTINVCFGTLATQSSWKWSSIQASHSLRSRFILTEKLSKDITCNRHEEPQGTVFLFYLCSLSFSISGLQRMRNTDKLNESLAFRLHYNDNTEPAERPSGRHKEAKLSHCPSVVGRLTSWSAYSLNHRNTSTNDGHLVGANLNPGNRCYQMWL